MISVIIPAHNEERYILNTVESVRNQTYKNFEIIVVDDGSNDRTSEVIKSSADYLVKLNKKHGIAKAKNIGFEKSSGDLLVFLDADTILTPKVLDEIEKKKKEFDIGTCSIMPDNQKFKHKFAMALKNKILCPFGVSNGILFCSRSIFVKYGPFDENLKKREEGALLRTIKRNGRFTIIKEPVISSMRRFENKGYFAVFLYWIKEAIKPTNDEYEVIR